MKRYLLILLFLLLPCAVFAEEEVKIALTPAPIDASDIASIKRGAQFFAANCMSCHTLVYMRYNKLAQEAGVTYEKMPVNIKSWPYGVSPPDLSLEADAKGVDWIYTYLHSFYQDASRPSGVNNLVFPNTAMPGIITTFQGTQVKAEKLPTALFHKQQWFDLVVLEKQGTMTPDKFDQTVTDVVNFLAYAAHPYESSQKSLGWWVLGFLVILFVLAFYLKKEYWKDVKRK